VWRAPPRIEAILASAEKLSATDAELGLVHGDLHQRHVLVDAGALTAIIDWGDVCRADPCIDLAPYWSLLTPAGRERFLAEYGWVTDEQLLRARVLAIGLDSMLARYAHEVGDPRLERGTTAALERTLVD
jgi:aminoglycoside phosphotransferase (APT) family kinase protein